MNTPAKKARKSRARSSTLIAHTDGDLRELGLPSVKRPMMRELYRRAEAQIQHRKPFVQSNGEPIDSQRLLQELQVHQMELQMQNAELQDARNQIETLLATYTDLYHRAPVGYLTMRPDGTILLANHTVARLLATDPNRLRGRRLTQRITPNDRAKFQAFLEQVFITESKQHCEVQLSGSSKWVTIEAKRSENAADCRAVLVDVTDERQNQEEVRLSEVRYRRLFEAAHDGVLLLDPITGKITDANPFMTQLLGYPQRELVGKELFEIGLLKDARASQEMFRRLKRKHEVRYEDLPLKSNLGRHQEVEVVANLYREGGQPVIQCNIRDITARKQNEETLRRSEALFSALIEQAPFGVYVVDHQLRLHRANSKALKVFNNIQGLVGQDFDKLIHRVWPRRIADGIARRFRATLRTGVPYQSLNFYGRRKDLRVTECYEWQIQRVTLPTGTYGVVCFFNDLTERRQQEAAERRIEVLAASNQRLEREIIRRRAVEAALKRSESHQASLLEHSVRQQEHLRQLSRQILSAQEDERKLISRELHDVIAQTLTGINVRLAGLKADIPGSVNGLDRNIQATQRLVEHSVEVIHRFARDLRPAVLDDLGLIPALQTYLNQFTTRTGIRTHLRVSRDLNQIAPALRTVLYRVAQEALTNVARHARATRVEVTLRKEARSFSMRIQDDGRSFDVQKTLRATAGKRLGMLGMSERLEMIGGSFVVHSSPGNGTCVEARIPIRAAHPKPSRSSRRAA